MFGLGNAVRFVAMRFAAQTVLSGLGSLQFVFIPLASRTLLGIRALPATLVGVAVVLLGEGGVGWAGVGGQRAGPTTLQAWRRAPPDPTPPSSPGR